MKYILPYRTFSLLLIVLLAFGACKSKKVIVVDNSDSLIVENKDSTIVSKKLAQYAMSEVPAYFTGNYTGTFIDSTKSVDFMGTLKLVKDSSLQIVGSPGLGIEAFRLYAGQDSVVFLNRLKREAFIFKSNKQINFVTYLQEILFGNINSLENNGIVDIHRFLMADSIKVDENRKITNLMLHDVGNMKQINICYSWLTSDTNLLPKTYKMLLNGNDVFINIEEYKFDAFTINPPSISNKYEIKYRNGL